MEELCLITTFRKSLLFTLSCVSVEACRSLSRPSLEKPLHLKLSQVIPLRTLRPKFKTRKEFLQISSVSSLLENNWKMAEPCQTTTSRRNLHFTWFLDFVVVCKSSSKLWLARLSLLKWNPATPLKMWRLRFKTRKVFPQISSVLSLLESNWKMAEPCPTITSRRNLHFTWFLGSVEACRSSSRPSLEKRLLLKWNPATPLRTSKQRFRTRKEFHQINSV